MQDYNINNPNDVFDDKNRLLQARELIGNNIEEIRQDKNALNSAWLLVQHMDDDPGFQKWFHKFLKQNTNAYRMLYDRRAVNAGIPQQSYTQRTDDNPNPIELPPEL